MKRLSLRTKQRICLKKRKDLLMIQLEVIFIESFYQDLYNDLILTIINSIQLSL